MHWGRVGKGRVTEVRSGEDLDGLGVTWVMVFCIITVLVLVEY